MSPNPLPSFYLNFSILIPVWFILYFKNYNFKKINGILSNEENVEINSMIEEIFL